MKKIKTILITTLLTFSIFISFITLVNEEPKAMTITNKTNTNNTISNVLKTTKKETEKKANIEADKTFFEEPITKAEGLQKEAKQEETKQQEKQKQKEEKKQEDKAKNNSTTPPLASSNSEKKVSFNSLVKNINNIPVKYLDIANTLLEAIQDGTEGQIEFEFNSREGWKELESAIEYILPYTYYNLNIGYAERGHYFSNTETTTYYIAVINKDKLRECYKEESIIESYVKSASAVVKAGMTEREAYKAIHDYVCDYLNYDFSYSVRSLSLAFDKRIGVCEAYARMTKALCDYVGIQCQYITGYAENSLGSGYHAWNRVNINNKWYYTDTCWDGSYSKTVNTYFLSESLWENHTLD